MPTHAMRARGLRVLAAAVLVLSGCRRPGAPRTTLQWFVAASAAEVSAALAEQVRAQTGAAVQRNLAASSVLARQITRGADCDVFISAHRRWVDHVVEHLGLPPERCRPLAGNRLVVVVPLRGDVAAGGAQETAGDRGSARLPWTSARCSRSRMAHTLRVHLSGRVAVGDPRHVPAGMYAREALETLGMWSGLTPRLLPAPDVRAALRLVQLGEADAGIVYATDARAAPGVRVVATLPSTLHTPIVYWAVQCSEKPAAARFMSSLDTPAVRTLLRAHGFVPMDEASP